MFNRSGVMWRLLPPLLIIWLQKNEPWKKLLPPHRFRTIILQFDESKTAPDFETEGLAMYYKLHDRYGKLSGHIHESREKAAKFYLKVEQVSELFAEAKSKFNQLKVMVPDNPEKPRIKKQLKLLLNQSNALTQGFIVALRSPHDQLFWL